MSRLCFFGASIGFRLLDPSKLATSIEERYSSEQTG